MFAAIPLIQKIVGGVALGLILMLALAWQIEKRSANKWEARAIDLTAQLKAISTKRNEQAQVTKGSVEKARVIYRDAERVAERIEAAPLPGQCATPREILSADL